MTVRRYTLKDGSTRWRARVNVLDKQAKREGFRTREEAEDWYAEKRKELLASRDAGNLYGPDVTLGELAEKWLEHKRPRHPPSTIDDYELQLNKRILPAFRDEKIRRITTRELQQFLDGLDSPAKVRKSRAVLSSMFKLAIAWSLINSDPTHALVGVSERRKEMRFLTYEEAQLLMSSMEGQWRMITYLGLFTGMRIGEILALQYRDIRDGNIRVNKSVRKGSLGPPKGGKARWVVIPDEVTAEVRSWRAAAGNPPSWAKIFSKPDGRYLRAWDYGKRLGRVADRIGIGHVRPHDLRHTYAAWCLSAGVNPQFVQRQLGHGSMKTTMDNYGHLMPSVKTAFREWLSGEIGRFSDEMAKTRKPVTYEKDGNIIKPQFRG